MLDVNKFRLGQSLTFYQDDHKHQFRTTVKQFTGEGGDKAKMQNGTSVQNS